MNRGNRRGTTFRAIDIINCLSSYLLCFLYYNTPTSFLLLYLHRWYKISVVDEFTPVWKHSLCCLPLSNGSLPHRSFGFKYCSSTFNIEHSIISTMHESCRPSGALALVIMVGFVSNTQIIKEKLIIIWILNLNQLEQIGRYKSGLDEKWGGFWLYFDWFIMSENLSSCTCSWKLKSY